MNNKLEKLEQKFSELAREIYEQGERRIRPTWPWVLIRLMPKEQKIGHIICPEGSGAKAQNKPLAEGIVLATWEPHWSRFIRPAKETVDSVWRESEFEIGDRVLFPSFAGLPVNFLDDRTYRLVREWTFDELGGVMCKVHYEGDNKYKEALDELFAEAQSVTMSGR